MRHRSIITMGCLVLLLGPGLETRGAAAGGEHAGSFGTHPSGFIGTHQPTHNGIHEIRPGGFFAPQFPPHPFAPNFGRGKFDHRHFSHRSFGGFVGFGGGTVVYVAPPPFYGYGGYSDTAPSYDQEAPYSAPIVYSQPAATVAVAPTPPPPPRVIEYSTGRYELRGDGVTVPYTWQWIANVPPPPPPPAAAPAAAPAATPAGAEQTKREKHGPLYRWTDDQNVVYWTDDLDTVPDQYRGRVKQLSAR